MGCENLSPSKCRNTADLNFCLNLTNENLLCLNSVNGECRGLLVNECRDPTNSSFVCSLIEDGWCLDNLTSNCV